MKRPSAGRIGDGRQPAGKSGRCGVCVAADFVVGDEAGCRRARTVEHCRQGPAFPVALLADKLNGFEIPELLSGQPDRWKRGLDDGGNGGQLSVSVSARKQGVFCRSVSLGVRGNSLET
jgi:hypothetical protein